MRRLEEKRRIESSSKIYMKKHGGKSERECGERRRRRHAGDRVPVTAAAWRDPRAACFSFLFSASLLHFGAHTQTKLSFPLPTHAATYLQVKSQPASPECRRPPCVVAGRKAAAAAPILARGKAERLAIFEHAT